MAGYLLLGIFEEAIPAANAIERVRQLGVPDNRVTVMSPYPIKSTVLGRRHPSGRLILITLIGTVLGILTALALVGGTQLLYPVRVGGQPLWPVPPQLIILFELTMLGTMWATFIGFVLMNRLPTYGEPLNDPRIMAGHIGVVVETDQHRADRAEEALRDTGAIDVRRVAARQQIDLPRWWLWLVTVLLILGVLSVAGGLFAYDIIRIPFGTQMADQFSVAYEQGPRLAAPAEAVPVQGPALIGGQPGSAPIPSSPASLQRGQVLFNQHCALCHNTTGTGDGPLSGFFTPKPFDLTSAQVQGLSDQQIFVVITQGFGTMPSIREDLTPTERWDVVNWVRSLKK